MICLFPSPIDMDAHKPIISRWHTTTLTLVYPILFIHSSSSFVHIVHFSLLCIVVNLTIFKTCLLERSFHTLIKNVWFVPISNPYRSHVTSYFWLNFMLKNPLFHEWTQPSLPGKSWYYMHSGYTHGDSIFSTTTKRPTTKEPMSCLR